ncbi:MAG TPA: thioredoxin family protein [Clostridiaceae bacterium]|nr:thioredoxin family protein [Clostridiaceae bacterium]
MLRGLLLMDKKKLVKIIVPVCIVLIIAGIWIFKNANSDAPPITDNKDFTLEATNIDLEVLTSYELPIIIDFGADSCIPCKEMAPVLKTLNVEMQGAAIIKFVDVWKNEDVANDFPIQVIPTQIFINADGTPYVPSDDIKIEFTMYSTKDTNEHVFTIHQGGLTEDQMRRILTDMGVGK